MKITNKSKLVMGKREKCQNKISITFDDCNDVFIHTDLFCYAHRYKS